MGNHKNYSSKQVDGKYINYYYQIACDNKLTSDARTIIQRMVGSAEHYIIKQPTLIVEYGWSDNAMTTALNVLKANNYLYIDDNDFYHLSSSGNLMEEAKAAGVIIPVYVPSPSVKERLEHLEKQKENNRKGYDKKRKAKMKKKNSIIMLPITLEMNKKELPEEPIKGNPAITLPEPAPQKNKIQHHSTSIPVLDSMNKSSYYVPDEQRKQEFERVLNNFVFNKDLNSQDIKKFIMTAYINSNEPRSEISSYPFIYEQTNQYKLTLKSI